MQWINHTSDIEFTILGFPFFISTPVFSFISILVIYIFSVSENMFIILITRIDPNLHKPMYFFLGNLSFVDISFTTIILPKTLTILLLQRNTIYFAECITQMYFFLAAGVTESFLLTVMSYDRYVAICNPLKYSVIMKSSICTFMIMGCWLCGLLGVLFPIIIISRLPLCQSHVINHFFCDISPVIQLSCSDIHHLEIFFTFVASFVILGTLPAILLSYVHIIRNILGISSSTGRKKTFSTCVSHLIIVILYYGSISFMYIRPRSKSNLDLDKGISVFYSVITPTLNPIIYTLRNKELKDALKKILRRWFHSYQ